MMDRDIDVYQELAIDLLTAATGLTMFQTKQIVAFLDQEGFIDYDQLKEYYLYEDE